LSRHGADLSGAMVTGFRYAGVLALLALAGCGGHAVGGAASSPTADAQDVSVKFAQCMRQHGVNIADPKPGDRGIKITGQRLDQAKMDAAMRACRKYAPSAKIDPNDPKVRDQMLKLAQCLRQHGVQVADPQPGQGIRIQLKNPDAKTQQAVEACDKLVPRPSGSPTSPAKGG
jgi:hypothetical protein